jgi:signal peptidase
MSILRVLQITVIVTVLVAASSLMLLLLAPRAAGWSTFVVLSGSMEPAMPVGGLSFVEPRDEDTQIRVGDVVTYRRPDDESTLVSHRVHAITDHLGEPTIWTVGDANEAPDPWAITEDQVIGRVRFTLPFVGQLSQDIRSRNGALLLIGPIAALVIITELVSIASNLRKIARERRRGAPTEAEQRLLCAGEHPPRPNAFGIAGPLRVEN